MTELDRLAEVLGKLHPGKVDWESVEDYYCRPGLLLAGEETVAGYVTEDNGRAICAAMNTIDALVEVAKKAAALNDTCVPIDKYGYEWECSPGAASDVEQALTALDAAITEALK